MENSVTFSIGDKVKIIEHTNTAYVGKTGVLVTASKLEILKSWQIISELGKIPLKSDEENIIICIVKLEDTGNFVSCLLRQLRKVK